jgi:Tfp pilus assembly protein PilF
VLVSCSSCGSNSLKRVQRGVYLCDYCGSKFFVDDDNRIESAEVADAKLISIFEEAAKHDLKDEFSAELQVLTKGLDLAPQNYKLMIKLGRVYRRLGFAQEALKYYEKAKTLNPRDPTIYTNLGTLYLTREMCTEAKPYYEKAMAMIEADPLSVTPDDAAVTYGNYALCVGKMGDLREARKYLSLAKQKGYSKDSIKHICDVLHFNPKLI